jgi:Family of unknown function (DUF6659)
VERDYIHMTDRYDKFGKLCNDIFTLSPTIRSAVVIDKIGKLVAGGMREGIKSMEDKEDSQKLYVEFALRSVMREEFDEEFGKTIYSFSEREKIKLASFPLDNHHILRVSIKKEEDRSNEIIDNILKIIGKNITPSSQ